MELVERLGTDEWEGAALSGSPTLLVEDLLLGVRETVGREFLEELREEVIDGVARRGADICWRGEAGGLGPETLELGVGDREVVDLLELREFEKIDGEDREVELCCLAEGDDVERDADGLERLY